MPFRPIGLYIQAWTFPVWECWTVIWVKEFTGALMVTLVRKEIALLTLEIGSTSRQVSRMLYTVGVEIITWLYGSFPSALLYVGRHVKIKSK